MIKLYGSFPSRSNRVMWALEELEQPYDFIEIDFAAGDAGSDEFLALNPAGKVPVLVKDDLVLTESGAICTYLGDCFPDKNLTPTAGSNDRAKYGQWMYFAQSELEQPLWTKAKHKFALPKEYRVADINAATEYEFSKALDLLSQGLSNQEFMLGDQFSMVDIMITHTLIWARNARMDLVHDNLKAYMKKNLSREACQRLKEKERIPFSAAHE